MRSKINKKILLSLLIVLMLGFCGTGIKAFAEKRKFAQSVEESLRILSFEDFVLEAQKNPVFTEYLNKYPQALEVFKQTPRFRRFYLLRNYFLEEFFQYLNEHPVEANKILDSGDPALELEKVFFGFEWK